MGYSPFFLNYGRHPRKGIEPHVNIAVESADVFASRMHHLAEEEAAAALTRAVEDIKRHCNPNALQKNSTIIISVLVLSCNTRTELRATLTVTLVWERLRSSRAGLRVRGLHKWTSAPGRTFMRSRVGRERISASRGGPSFSHSESPSMVGEATWDW